jgi:hypothetical protein
MEEHGAGLWTSKTALCMSEPVKPDAIFSTLLPIAEWYCSKHIFLHG